MSLRLDLEGVEEALRNLTRDIDKVSARLQDVVKAHLDGTVRPRSPDMKPRVPAADFKALESAIAQRGQVPQTPISGRNQVAPVAVDQPK